jgi:hypothetical protein
LDGFFGKWASDNTFALWVEVEGNTKSVLAGAGTVLANTVFVKPELETMEYWQGQALAPEMIAYMEDAGFKLLVTADPGVEAIRCSVYQARPR